MKEPNNKGSDQDCVEIYIKRNKEAGKWNDERCTKKKRALCYQASCHPSSCTERSECVETIGNYTCQCYPGFFGPQCEHVAKCRDLDDVRRPLLMNCSHPLGKFSYRSNCGFSCDNGFELSGPATLQCLPFGNWTAEIPQCQAVQCKPLNFPTHGNFSCSHIHGDFQYQSSCKFKCAEGFQISGAETTVCEQSGQWSSLEPACQVKECQRIESPAKGAMNCVHPISDFAYNSTCDFSCEPGFRLSSSKTLRCNASGQWTSSVPICHAVQCQPLPAPPHGNISCFHLHGEFQYQSNCTFHCLDGFLLIGEEITQCTSQGEWITPAPFCRAIDCPKLDAPKNGESNCTHPYSDFAYSSSCAFSCKRGFVQVGAQQLQCTALGTWTEKMPFCELIECSKLDVPENGGLNCSHPYGDFAYSSRCVFSCNQGFSQVGAEQLDCTSLGMWTERPPFCKAARCPALHKPDNGHLNCAHPHGNFAYGSNCNFSCNVGFQLVGMELLHCSALGNWTEQTPYCQGHSSFFSFPAVQCPGLEVPDNGNANCSNPYEPFAYSSSCIFSCNSGFELSGSKKLKCTEQGNWKGEMPTCEAIKCSTLRAPVNGQLNCSHPFGTFRYNSSCMFSCDTGFIRAGTEMLNCTAPGEWTDPAPFCEAIKCSQLQNTENMQIDCFNPWGSFSYKSTCHFHCAEGYILNGTNSVECQLNGQWSAEMPVCQATVAPYFKQVLLYTGSVAASIIALVLFGGMITLAIRHFGKRESLLFTEIGDLIGEDELPLDAENETYENNFCDLDFDIDLMSWDSEPWDVSKEISADADWKADPLSPTTSAESVPSPVSVDSPPQHVPEGTELGSNSQPSPVSLYGQCSQPPSLPAEVKEEKPPSKIKHCSAKGSSGTLNQCHPRASKPFLQPKPLLPAFRESHASLGVQAKAIVIPAVSTLLTLPKQPPVVALPTAPPKGQPVIFPQSAVVHLQAPGILPATKATLTVTGGVTALPGQAVNILPQTAGKGLASANLPTESVLQATSPNAGIDVNVLKRQQRMIKNRESACQSRRKKKEYMLSLEARLKAALLENDHLKKENGALKRQMNALAEENQNLKNTPPKRRTFYVMVLVAFLMLNYDRLGVLDWGSNSSEVHTRPAHQSRHLLEFSAGVPQETEGRNNNGYKHSISDNKALMVVTEEPIIYISPPPCQPFINRTESLRHELRGWVHRHEAERTRSRRMSKNHQQKDQTVQNSSGRNANSELMPLPYIDNTVSRNSGSELQVYYASPRNYQDFFDAIHRRGDTFYVVSFRR
ncbi:hypothetical protein JRQ81_014589, partial [Phrynocephalus forsythii]